MTNIISLVEDKNRLDFETTYAPIVCGNSNYYLKFKFGAEWEECESKTAMFVVEGKKILVEFSGSVCKVPVLPNCTSILVAVFSANEQGEQLSTTFLRIKTETSALGEDFADYDDRIKKYISTVIGAVNALENGSLVCKLAKEAQNVINDNLLINGNFTIDQKGQSYYNCITKCYTVDRWLAYAGMKLQKLDSGATVFNTHSSKKGWFKQIMDKPYSEIAGKDVALSIKVNGEMFWGSCVVPEEMPTEETYFIEVNLGNQGGAEDAVLAFVCSAEGVLSVALYVTSGASMTIDYIKLECSSTPTAFVPRPESEELALCQRYLQVVKGSAVNSFVGFAMTTGTDEIRSLSKNILQIPLVCHMRTTPSIRKIGSLYLVQGSTKSYVEAYAYDNYNKHIASVSLSSGNYADGTVTMATMTDDASRFEIDAEIY